MQASLPSLNLFSLCLCVPSPLPGFRADAVKDKELTAALRPREIAPASAQFRLPFYLYLISVELTSYEQRI